MSNNISNVILDSVKFKNKTCLRKKIKINKIKKKRKKRKSRWGKSEIELLNEEANRKCERKRVVLVKVKVRWNKQFESSIKCCFSWNVPGAVVAQWVWSWFNLKTLCAKGRRFKSPSGHLIQRKFSMKRKNSMIYGPTTTVLHSQPSDTYWARLGKKKKNNFCSIFQA